MSDIQGYWYDGQQSAQQLVVLRCSGDQHIEVLSGQSAGHSSPVLVSVPAGQLTFSSRLGYSTRYIYFPNGQKFETRDNDGVDELVRQLKPGNRRGLLHYLETRWSFVAISCALVVCLGIWMFTDGVPVTSKYLAQIIPQTLKAKAGEQTLELMDEQWMGETTLSEEEQARVRKHFVGIMDEYQAFNIRLLFRDGGSLGANAFALPDGTIIFTDDIIKLSEDDDELLAIMAHEVGHVVHNHGMRNVIQSSMISILVAMVAGDASAASDIFLTLPVLLTQLGYSRDFEREADDFALQYLLEKQLDLKHFVAVMTRLQNSHCEESTNKEDAKDCHSHSHLQQYLSTHPATQERLEKFKNH